MLALCFSCRIGFLKNLNRVEDFVRQHLVELQAAAQAVGYNPIGIYLSDFIHQTSTQLKG
jgi:hypothetical protein